MTCAQADYLVDVLLIDCTQVIGERQSEIVSGNAALFSSGDLVLRHLVTLYDNLSPSNLPIPPATPLSSLATGSGRVNIPSTGRPYIYILTASRRVQSYMRKSAVSV